MLYGNNLNNSGKRVRSDSIINSSQSFNTFAILQQVISGNSIDEASVWKGWMILLFSNRTGHSATLWKYNIAFFPQYFPITCGISEINQVIEAKKNAFSWIFRWISHRFGNKCWHYDIITTALLIKILIKIVCVSIFVVFNQLIIHVLLSFNPCRTQLPSVIIVVWWFIRNA